MRGETADADTTQLDKVQPQTYFHTRTGPSGALPCLPRFAPTQPPFAVIRVISSGSSGLWSTVSLSP